MELPTIVVAALTVVSPLLTSVFTRVSMTSAQKNNVAVAVSFVIAAVYVIMSGGVHDLTNVAEIAGVLPAVFTLQQLVFQNLLRGLSDKVEARVGVKDPAPAALPSAPGPDGAGVIG